MTAESKALDEYFVFVLNVRCWLRYSANSLRILANVVFYHA